MTRHPLSQVAQNGNSPSSEEPGCVRVAIDAVGIRGHGAAAVLCEFCRWLPVVRPQWRWHVFLLDRPSREFDDPIGSDRLTIEQIRVGHSNVRRLHWVNRGLPDRLRSMRPDALFSFANIAPAHSCAAQVVFCQQPNAFLSEALHAFSLFRRLRLRFMRGQILRGARASQAMIVQTKAMHDRILELEPSLKERVHVIPSGYRTLSDTLDLRLEKKTIVDGADRPRLIYVTHPAEHKNHRALIRAMPRVLEAIPSACLLLTLERHRSGNARYNAMVEDIRSLAESLGVAERLVWLGILNPDEVHYALSSSDLMVFPSLAESFGLGLVESMAAECPVAAADLPYARDVCGEAAVYFDPDDPASIAQTVNEVFRNASTLERLRSLGNRHKDRFSYRRIAEEVAGVIQRAVNDHSRRRPADRRAAQPGQSGWA